MIFWSIRITILSLVLIFVLHNLYGFFKNTLTTPKIKDLVNKPQKKYDEIINIIQSNKSTIVNETVNETPQTNIPKREMKDELKHFLSEIKNKPDTSNLEVKSTDSFSFSSSGANSFANDTNDYANAYSS